GFHQLEEARTDSAVPGVWMDVDIDEGVSPREQSAISAGTAMTAPASAAPIIIRDTVTTPIFEADLTDDCLPGLTGTIVGTDDMSYQSVETRDGFHIQVTFVDTARIDWTDGSYTLIDAVDH